MEISIEIPQENTELTYDPAMCSSLTFIQWNQCQRTIEISEHPYLLQQNSQ
jgi:hypothetical protein